MQKVCKERRGQSPSEQYGKVMSKILDKIDIFIRAGNLAVKAAPESVGLAWMGISLVLSSIQDDYQTLQVFGSGCADIVGIMISCRLFTRMFSTPSGPEELHEIQDKVIEEVTKLYVKVLEFSYQAWKYVGENKLGKQCFCQTRWIHVGFETFADDQGSTHTLEHCEEEQGRIRLSIRCH